jgi:hypothetical protein
MPWWCFFHWGTPRILFRIPRNPTYDNNCRTEIKEAAGSTEITIVLPVAGKRSNSILSNTWNVSLFQNFYVFLPVPVTEPLPIIRRTLAGKHWSEMKRSIIHIFFLSALHGGKWSALGNGYFNPSKWPPQDLLDMRLSAPQWWSSSWEEHKTPLPLPDSKPPVIQSILFLSHYSDWAIPTPEFTGIPTECGQIHITLPNTWHMHWSYTTGGNSCFHIIICVCRYSSEDIKVNVVTCYRLDGPGLESQ